MDALDIKILGILRKNARMPFSELGKQISLSTSAVVERVRKLEKSGVISRYAAIIDGKAYQKDLMALMFISLESPKLIDNFLEFVNKENDIIECHYITGNYDYILKIITRNTGSLELILNEIKSQPGVIKTYTNVVLKTTKNEYSINPDT